MKFAYIDNENRDLDSEDIQRSGVSVSESSEGFDAWIKHVDSVPILETATGHSYKADWSGSVIQNRLKTIGKRQPLYKAINIDHTKWVLDATFGLGVDSLGLLKLGVKVVAFERNPLLYLMGRIQIRHNNGRPEMKFLEYLDLKFGTALEQIDANNWLENGALYYDPMYPQKKRSALPKGEMQLLAEICSSGDEFDLIYEKFLNSTMSKLVVKRPRYIQAHQDKVSHSVESKLVRYDVYRNPNS